MTEMHPSEPVVDPFSYSNCNIARGFVRGCVYGCEDRISLMNLCRRSGVHTCAISLIVKLEVFVAKIVSGLNTQYRFVSSGRSDHAQGHTG